MGKTRCNRAASPPNLRPSTINSHPSTLPLVVFALDDLSFALELDAVEKVVRAVEVTPLPGAPDAVLGIISVAGDIVPVCDLRGLFGHPARAARATDHLAIVHTSRRRLALLVDAPVEVTNATAVKITAPPAQIMERFSLRGAVQLVDGIVLIHDLERFLSTDDETALDAALVPHAPGASASAQ